VLVLGTLAVPRLGVCHEDEALPRVPTQTHPVGTVAPGPQRQGFTFELSLGAGLQALSFTDAEFEGDDRAALAGLNLGIGGFLRENVALLFRIIGTTAFYESGIFSVTQTAGVGGIAAQYWATDTIKLEGGIGFAILSIQADSDFVAVTGDDEGFGFLASVAWAFWQNARHSLQIELSYAPGFFGDVNVQNLGMAFGWQLL